VCHCKGHYGHRKSIQTNTIPVRWVEATIFDANQFRRTYPHWGQIIFFAALCVTSHHSFGWFNWAKVNEHLHETILFLFLLKYGNLHGIDSYFFPWNLGVKDQQWLATFQTVAWDPSRFVGPDRRRSDAIAVNFTGQPGKRNPGFAIFKGLQGRSYVFWRKASRDDDWIPKELLASIYNN
jgi:hypothetical protein